MGIHCSFSEKCLKIVGCSSNAVNLSTYYFMFTSLLGQSRSMFLDGKRIKTQTKELKKIESQIT